MGRYSWRRQLRELPPRFYARRWPLPEVLPRSVQLRKGKGAPTTPSPCPEASENQRSMQQMESATVCGFHVALSFCWQEEDEQDRFERMQEVMLPAGPDSVSFYKAKMKTDQKVMSAGPSSL